MTVYVTIGNSDNKLTQEEWAHFTFDVGVLVQREATEIYGRWFSEPGSIFQNYCIGFDVDSDRVARLKTSLGHARKRYRQDSIAWAVAETEFISG